MKKIPVEELMEKASNWWSRLDDGQSSQIIVKHYMKWAGIKNREVDW